MSKGLNGASNQDVHALFEPIEVGEMKLANRMVMAPMTRNRAEPDGTPQPMMATYYAQRATAGLIITEATYISPQAKGYPGVPGIISPKHAAAWQNVVEQVNANGGKIVLQLWHSGRVAHSSVIGHSMPPVAPSAIPPEGEVPTPIGFLPYETPHALTKDEIADVVKQHVTAAKRAMEIGFDAVEVHGANGYLLDQFLRDGSNKRTDAYGGSLENRARLMIETVEAVTKAIGPGRVGVRLSPFNATNSMHDSDPLTTFSYVSKRMGELGLAYLHVTRMGVENAGEQAFDISELGKAFGGTTILNGGYTRKSGADAVNARDGDLIAYGMPYTSNPDLVERFMADAELALPDPNALYSGGEFGYTDFESLVAQDLSAASVDNTLAARGADVSHSVDFDIVICGGGLAGSSLAIALADTDLRVLVVEHTERFEDRVRGEGVMPWGVAEMEKIGIDKILLESCAKEVMKHRELFSGMIVDTRKWEQDDQPKRGVVCYQHAEMQQTLLAYAGTSGATVWRGAKVTGIERTNTGGEEFEDGHIVRVEVSRNGKKVPVNTKILVGADGRVSNVAKLAGIHLNKGSNGVLTSGVLLKNFWGPSDTTQHANFPQSGRGAIIFPVDDQGTARAYFCAHRNSETKLLRGESDISKFVGASISTGMNAASYAQAEPVGPLFTYDGTHTWLDRAYENGIVLVGDAASTGDPAFGNGQSLTMRDVRTLSEAIKENDSLVEACRDYATQADDYYHRLRRVEEWFTDLFFDVSEEGEQRRQRALPLHMMDGTRAPDLLGLGPEAPNDEIARMRMFGEI